MEAISIWGDAGLGKTGFSPEECWALRRGKPHQVAAEIGATSRLLCRHLAAEASGAHRRREYNQGVFSATGRLEINCCRASCQKRGSKPTAEVNRRVFNTEKAGRIAGLFNS